MSLNFLAWTFGLGPDLRRCYKYSYKDAHKALLQYEDEDEDEDVGSGPLSVPAQRMLKQTCIHDAN